MSHEAGCTSCGKWWSLEDCWSSLPHSNTGTPPNYNITSGNGERFYILFYSSNLFDPRFAMKETAVIGGRQVSIWKMK